ncbi:DNA/RNA helicase domain-containing protein [Streptomyces albidoflavus]|uniref:DNA/RNA helicase domain-containing protein n=1 Tax=Streptomyces albidoflavus TaxID=1886 RepID=UPI0013EE9978|nr:DNA/RNA helicase domain-containing protein [Streptomyces albidoflavus]
MSAHPAARELFPPAGSLRATARQTGALVIDSVVEQVPLAAIFLNERQVIRPHEDTTVAEISAVARRAGRTHRHLELDASFRCTGAAYTGWVDALLYGTPLPWTGHADYDLGLVRDPFQLESRIDRATAAGHTTRATAGFCWPWTRTRPGTRLPLDIAIDVPGAHAGVDKRTWRAAWNAAHTLTDPDGRVLAPRSQLWASHEGGHRQVGCVYTAQGLEYHHAGVIIGPDLTWADGRWHAHPDRSHDPRLRSLPAERYLRYALNTYRVPLTRGTHATRIHATDSATQHFLHRPIGRTSPNHRQDRVSAGPRPDADRG